jgi:hypothetical protein
LLLVVAGLIGACSGDDMKLVGGSDGGDTAAVDQESDARAPAALGRALERGIAYDSGTTTGAAGSGSGGGSISVSNSGNATGGGVGDTFERSPVADPSIIKTASVELEVARDGLDEATRDAISIAGRHGGFVLSTATETQRSASSSVVVRIPASSFERALADLEALGDVNAEEISGQDVSQEFVDLEARTRNLEAQETVLLRLMDKSVSVSDSIRVQRELQGVQLEIERLTGRLRFLKDQADMGTISLSFVEVGAPGHQPPTGVLAKAWARAVDVAMGVVAAVIVGTGFLVPVAVIAAVGFLVLRALRPRFGS